MRPTDSTQGASAVRDTVAPLFGVPPANVRVISPHVGGGFGSKGSPRPHLIIAAVASKQVGRPVKLAVTRQQMFAVTGYRTPTIQRVRLGANADGRLTAIVHDAFEQSSTITEFAEQTTTPTRIMYAAPRFTVRIAAADIGTGARTVLTQIAGDTLRTSPDRVRVEIGDSALPTASLAGGSMGTASWGTAVVRACEALVDGLDRTLADRDRAPEKDTARE